MTEQATPATQAVKVSQPAHTHTNTPTVAPKKYRAVIECGRSSFESKLNFPDDLSAAINLIGMVLLSNGAATNFELFREDGSRVCVGSPWALLAQMAPALSEHSKRRIVPMAVIPKSEKNVSDLFRRDAKEGGK